MPRRNRIHSADGGNHPDHKPGQLGQRPLTMGPQPPYMPVNAAGIVSRRTEPLHEYERRAGRG